MQAICSVEGCSSPVDARGVCGTHYMRLRRAGSIPVGTRARGPVEERFFRYFEKTDGCWIWTGKSMSKKGYAQIQIGGKGSPKILAHRLSYQIHKGEIPDGMVVMHKCDNPSCVNPDHLEVGSQSQNIKDAFLRKRKTAKPPHKFGESHYASKMKEADVLLIRESKERTADLALKYSVSKSAIERIKNRVTWKHLT